MMTSLKTTRKKEIPEAKTRKRSAEVKKTLTPKKMRQLQSKHRGRRAKRVDEVALTRKLKTPIGVTTTVVLKVRIKVVVIVVATVIVVVIGIGIEVRVKRRGDENEAKQAKKSDLQMRCIYMLPLKVAKDCNTSHQEIFI